MDYLASPRNQPASALQWMARLSASRFNANAGLCSDVLVSIALIGVALWRNDESPLRSLAVVASGLLVFSLAEYVIHRWVFHGPISMFEEGHRRHHEEPLGHDALPFFLPPLAMLLLAALMASFLPLTTALLLAGSIATGYATYGLSHSIIHHFRFRYALARRWAALHHIHHNHPERNFGVTSPLWDLLMRTQYISVAKTSRYRPR